MLLVWKILWRFSDRPFTYGKPIGAAKGLVVFFEGSLLGFSFFFGKLKIHLRYPLASSASFTCLISFCLSSGVEDMASALWRRRHWRRRCKVVENYGEQFIQDLPKVNSSNKKKNSDVGPEAILCFVTLTLCRVVSVLPLWKTKLTSTHQNCQWRNIWFGGAWVSSSFANWSIWNPMTGSTFFLWLGIVSFN